MAATKPTAHLVGSVPLSDAETVFRTVSASIGLHLKRITDGETGERGPLDLVSKRNVDGTPGHGSGR